MKWLSAVSLHSSSILEKYEESEYKECTLLYMEVTMRLT